MRRVGRACYRLRKGIPLRDWPDAAMPDAANVLLATRLLNRFTGSSYTCEEVAVMDPLIFEYVEALEQGIRAGT